MTPALPRPEPGAPPRAGPAGGKDPRHRAPPGFRVARSLPAGRHALLAVFPGLDRLDVFGRLPADSAVRARLSLETAIEVVDAPIWMYVAPRVLPETMRRRGFTPVVSQTDCLVLGLGHLQNSEELVLCLDVIHELCHILKRNGGRELWDERFAYVDRPTELEAYRLSIGIARDLGADDEFLRDYLKVEWVSEVDLMKLYSNLGVAPP